MLKKYVHMLLASTVIAGGLTAATVVMGTVTATPAVAAIDLFLGVAPPEPRVEVVPEARPGYVWAPGYWEWRGHEHVWVGGRWMRARVGYHWVPDRWEHEGERYHYFRGGWVHD